MTRLTVSLPPLGTVERQIDDTLSSSFPASDPPSWTLGRTRKAPMDPSEGSAALLPARRQSDDRAIDDDAGESAGRNFAHAVASLLGAIGLALLVPIFVVLLPLALIWRLVLDIAGWSDWHPRIRQRLTWPALPTRSERTLEPDTTVDMTPWQTYS